MRRVDLSYPIQGRCLDGDASNELEHYVLCPECCQAVDLRDFDQVTHHEEPGHDWIPLDS